MGFTASKKIGNAVQRNRAALRKASGNWSTLPPQSEHVLLLGKKRPANTTCPPRMAALYSSCRPNSKKRISAMARARSSIVAAIAVDALGAGQVQVVVQADVHGVQVVPL